MTKTTVLAALYDFVLHAVAGNVIAGLVLLASTTGWQRIRARRAGRLPARSDRTSRPADLSPGP